MSRYDGHRVNQLKVIAMSATLRVLLVLSLFTVFGQTAWADSDAEAIDSFRSAGESGAFFNNSYGYAIFPTIGKGGFGSGKLAGCLLGGLPNMPIARMKCGRLRRRLRPTKKDLPTSTRRQESLMRWTIHRFIVFRTRHFRFGWCFWWWGRFRSWCWDWPFCARHR